MQEGNPASPADSWWPDNLMQSPSRDEVGDAHGDVRSGGGTAGTAAPMDAGNDGMPMEAAFKDYQDLRLLEAEIAKVEAQLLAGSARPAEADLRAVENMEGVDSDEDEVMASARRLATPGIAPASRKSKSMMTIRDLVPSYYDYDFVPPPAPVDAFIDTGRRLKDGAPFTALRSPAFGFSGPIYIQDVVWPCAIGALVVAISFCTVLLRSVRLSSTLTHTQKELDRLRHILPWPHHHPQQPMALNKYGHQTAEAWRYAE